MNNNEDVEDAEFTEEIAADRPQQGPVPSDFGDHSPIPLEAVETAVTSLFTVDANYRVMDQRTKERYEQLGGASDSEEELRVLRRMQAAHEEFVKNPELGLMRISGQPVHFTLDELSLAFGKSKAFEVQAQYNDVKPNNLTEYDDLPQTSEDYWAAVKKLDRHWSKLKNEIMHETKTST